PLVCVNYSTSAASFLCAPDFRGSTTVVHGQTNSLSVLGIAGDERGLRREPAGGIPCRVPANSLVDCESPVFMRVRRNDFFFTGKNSLLNSLTRELVLKQPTSTTGSFDFAQDDKRRWGPRIRLPADDQPFAVLPAQQ